MVLAWLCLSLMGLRPGFRQILLIGCLQAAFCAVYLPVVNNLVSVPLSIHTVIYIMIFWGIIRRVMRLSYKHSIAAVMLGFSIYSGIGAVTNLLFSLVSGHSYSWVSQSNWRWLPYFFAKLMINILVIFLVRRFNIRLADIWDANGNNRFLWIAALLSIQGILINFGWWRYFSQYKEYFSAAYFYFYVAVVTIILPIMIIVVIRQFVTLTKSEIDFRIQLDTLRHVKELLQTMRVQRHDFTHELQVVYGLLEVREFQEARDYLKKSVNEVAAASELVKTDNLGVTALLYTKTGLAEARKIDLQVKVDTNLRKLPLEARDINLILGNLIDNAMDAVAELPAAVRKVEVNVREELEGHVVEVKNYGPPIPPAIVTEIFKPGFSTKGEGRGMGLYSIQRLVHKYKGNVRVTSGNNCTCFQVVIP
ncbi:sensor histidine kinase [Methylomusa anaerophila]|nr:GHKL domain-containing protein [Methylomusa anaerophila]